MWMPQLIQFRLIQIHIFQIYSDFFRYECLTPAGVPCSLPDSATGFCRITMRVMENIDEHWWSSWEWWKILMIIMRGKYWWTAQYKSHMAVGRPSNWQLSFFSCDVCLLFFYCKKRFEYFDLLNHRTSTFVLQTVSSTDILRKVNNEIQK